MMLNTNGDTLTSKDKLIDFKIKSYFDSGLNILAINVYDSDDRYFKLLENAKIKALIVDDSSMNRKMVRRLLLLKGKLYV